MTYKPILLTLLGTFICYFSYAQDDAALFSRLRGISSNGIDFYNVDGIEITTQSTIVALNPSAICKQYKKVSGKRFKLKEENLIQDNKWGFPYYYAEQQDTEAEDIVRKVSNYFITLHEGSVTWFTFSSVNKTDTALEQHFIQLVKDAAIPDSIFSRLVVDTINFAGRNIVLGNACNWKGPNNIQCPNKGQMNWSVHKSMDDAKLTVDLHYKILGGLNGGAITMDTMVPVIFEDVEILARKIVYSFTGAKGLMVKASGGKYLAMYFIAAPIRGNYVSCAMSYWNIDALNENGLPQLLAEVMKLKN